ncbi:caspase, EACC1-associated type [Actinokineospora cianjurensis]|uniref:caspase, EACC1-associated type n=1 Tax=Actinokineospora cianjurensis TaxID=585224 RepID=UPI001476C3DE|nr:tetratricopeptide repeat protein [Actinokineospora cianjurensis]
MASSRAVLIGVSTYDDPVLVPIPAARNSLDGMRSLLTDPLLCGWAPESVTVLADPVQPGHLARQLRALARDTEDVLLVYYVGHGQLTPRGELCLTTRDTAAEDPDFTGLPFSWVKEAVRDSPAGVRLVVLDCCYAGRAIEALSGADQIADVTHVSGSYTLTATTTSIAAHFDPSDESACTTFTGQLIDLVRTGIPGGPAQLTFSALYPHLRRRLVGLGLPQPNQRGTDTADHYVLAANPTTGAASEQAEAWAERGVDWYASGHHDRAEAAFQEAVRLDPGSALCRTGLGNVVLARDRAAEAEAHYRAALAIDPLNQSARIGLGDSILDQGRATEAEAEIRAAIAMDQGNAQAWISLGELLDRTDRLPEAEHAYAEATRQDPDSPLAHALLGEVLVALGRLDEAESALREAIRLDPADPNPRLDLGGVLNLRRDLAGAEQEFREVVRLDPTLVAGHVELGGVLEARGEWKAAEAAYREAARLDPTSATIQLLLVDLLRYGSGPSDDALAACRRAVELAPEVAGTHSLLGDLLCSGGECDRAVAAYEAALDLDPDLVSAHVGIAECRYRRDGFHGGGWDRAETALEHAVRLAPADATVRFLRGELAWARGDLVAAEHETGESLRIKSNNRRATYTRGEALLGLQRFDEAEAHYRDYLMADPDDGVGYLGVGRGHHGRGEYARAEWWLERAVELMPESGPARRALASTLAELGRLDGAVEQLRAAIGLDDKSAYLELGRVLRTAGKADEAEQAYRDALRALPGWALAYRELGDLLSQQGRATEAELAYRHATGPAVDR